MVVYKTYLNNFINFYLFIELLKLNTRKTNSILLKINNFLSNLNNLNERTDHTDRQNKVDDENDCISSLFPIENADQLNNCEEKLKK